MPPTPTPSRPRGQSFGPPDGPRQRAASAALATLAAMALLAAAGGLAGCEREKPATPLDPPRPVKVLEVSAAGGRDEASALSGVVRGSRQSVLSFRVPGVLQKLDAEVGTVAREGEVVAEIDRRDYELRVNDLENQYKTADAQFEQLTKGARAEDLRILRSRVASAQSAEATAAAEYRRVQQLYSKDAAPKARLDQAKTQWDQAREAAGAAADELAKASAGGREEEIRAAIATGQSIRSNLEQARANLEDTKLKYPFDGVVSHKHVSNFEQVAAGQPILTLVDIQRVEVQFSLPERLISQVSRGQEVEARVLNFEGETFAAVITKVGVAADPATLTYPVFAEMDNPGRRVLPGMTAEVWLKVERGQGAFPVLPIHAVLEDKVSKVKYVWIYDPAAQAAARRDVRLGDLVSEGVEVLEGLAEGDKVIVAGVSRVREGMKVRLQDI